MAICSNCKADVPNPGRGPRGEMKMRNAPNALALLFSGRGIFSGLSTQVIDFR